MAAAVGPSWTDRWTAIGTVGAVIAAVGIALWSDFRTRKQLAEERRRAQEREQIAEAYAVHVLSAERVIIGSSDAEGAVKPLAVLIENRSSFTITRVEAQFCIGTSLVTHRKVTRLAGFGALPHGLRAGWRASDEDEIVTTDVLTPWNEGVRFESDDIRVQNLRGAYPIVRWTDRWGTRWEHKRGVVRQIRDDEPWAP